MFFEKKGCEKQCRHNGEEHQCRHEHNGEHCHVEGHCHHHGEKEGNRGHGCCGHGGRREGAGRKKNCEKIPFNRRLSEESINLIKEFARQNNITETEALERAIQSLKD